MCSHGMGVFQRAAGFETSGDAGRAERMTADLDFRTEFGRTALDHAPSIDPIHSRRGQSASATSGGAEERAFAIVAGLLRQHGIPIADGAALAAEDCQWACVAFGLFPGPRRQSVGADGPAYRFSGRLLVCTCPPD